jgi:splicing factor U2AF 65 kDa subunit
VRGCQVVASVSPMPGSGGAAGSGIEETTIALRVYVKFETKDAAIGCAKELHGKQFDKRTVIAAFVQPSIFDSIALLACYSV